MIDAKSKSVKMNFSALYSFMLNANYRSSAGILGCLLSVAAIAFLIIGWDRMITGRRIMLILVVLVFTVINPLALAFKTFQQLKLSPSYKKPLDYTFHDDGITVAQGEASQSIKWNMVTRIMMTNKMIAVYTSRVNAFVIPLDELGDDKGKIITAIVQFTMQYNPRISGNLKGYRSGKGI